MAITRAAVRSGSLADFYTSLDTTGIVRVAERLPIGPLHGAVRRQLARRTFPGVPVDLIRVTSPVSQSFVHGVRRIPRAEALELRAMYYGMRKFDESVSKRLAHSKAHVMVGLTGSSARTFARARDLGKATVLNFINSHPFYHNRYLKELAGLKSGDNEILPPGVVSDAEREIECSDLILVPSRFVEGQLLALGVDPHRIAVEPYGVDLSAFRPREPDERAGKKDKLVCLYVGQISQRKGIPVLIEAARRMAGHAVEFRLVGPLVSREVLRDMPDNVLYLGTRFHAELPELMRQADLFVMPTLDDAFGLVTLGAMASGLPVIVSDHAGSSEDVVGGINGVVVRAGEPADLVEEIARFAENADGRRQMGVEARRSIEVSRSWDQYAAKVLTRVGEIVAHA